MIVHNKQMDTKMEKILEDYPKMLARYGFPAVDLIQREEPYQVMYEVKTVADNSKSGPFRWFVVWLCLVVGQHGWADKVLKGHGKTKLDFPGMRTDLHRGLRKMADDGVIVVGEKEEVTRFGKPWLLVNFWLASPEIREKLFGEHSH